MASGVFNEYDVWDGDFEEGNGVSPDEYAEILDALYAISAGDIAGDVEHDYFDDESDEYDDTPACMICAERCPMDELGCDRGREYFGFGTAGESLSLEYDDVPF